MWLRVVASIDKRRTAVVSELDEVAGQARMAVTGEAGLWSFTTAPSRLARLRCTQGRGGGSRVPMM
jgi:hypothetical protein